MKRSALCLIILIIGVLVVSGCQPQEKKYTGPAEKVTLGAESSLLTAAVWVAENKGYFNEEGLDVTIKDFQSGKASFNDMLDNGVDISTVAPTPIMFNSFKRQDFSIFGTFVDSNEDVKVIASKDAGITTTADLIGKKIGIVDGSTSQFFLSAFLTFNNLKDSDVETIDFAPPDLPDALNDGEVDAIVIWEPHAYNAQQLLGEKAIRLPSSEVYLETFNFMVMNNFAQDNPEILKRFLKAIDRATTFMQNNKEESQTIVAERLDLDKEVMNALWDDFVFEISLSQSLILTLEDEARWAIQNKLTDVTKVPNYLNYIYLDALDEVNPKAVTIIR